MNSVDVFTIDVCKEATEVGDGIRGRGLIPHRRGAIALISVTVLDVPPLGRRD